MKRTIIILIGAFIFSFLSGMIYEYKFGDKETNGNAIQIQKTYLKENNLENDTLFIDEVNENNKDDEKVIDDWRLTLVNYENYLPENYDVPLADIDETRQFDKRAIGELFAMQRALKRDGIYDVWVQSSYRTIKYQKGLFDEKVNRYISLGKTQKEAEELTLQTINRSGTSEHHLGLAVDFNYVNYSFDKSKGFRWLQKNAENYGFIMRYRKDKEDVTKINYEPWHWRYVGVEHAKKINELDMCLEEYIEYLKK